MSLGSLTLGSLTLTLAATATIVPVLLPFTAHGYSFSC